MQAGVEVPVAGLQDAIRFADPVAAHPGDRDSSGPLLFLSVITSHASYIIRTFAHILSQKMPAYVYQLGLGPLLGTRHIYRTFDYESKNPQKIYIRSEVPNTKKKKKR